MQTPRIFISPALEAGHNNQYVTFFFEVVNSNAVVVNYGKKKVSRSLDMLRFAFKADVMILHWAEDVPNLKWGYFQFITSIVTILFFKIKGGKVVWFCHNRQPHIKTRRLFTSLLRKFYIRFSDNIIVHSSDALDELPANGKVTYLPHPVYSFTRSQDQGKPLPAYDVLIWGNMYPYKGLEQFIDNYKLFNHQSKVLIVGKATTDYASLLENKVRGTNITIKNEFLNEAELQRHFDGAKIILLPYLDTDTFCSGALIHSLNAGKIVIGPAIGNFLDLSNQQACLVYESYNDLFLMMEKLLKDPLLYAQQLKMLCEGMLQYRQQNTWNTFVTRLMAKININQKFINQPNKKRKIKYVLHQQTLSPAKVEPVE